jgi:glutamate synthase (NADPH/NADH) large chain
VYDTIKSDYWESVFLNLVKQHYDATQSQRSHDILVQYEQIKHKIYQICPQDMLGKLTNPLCDEGVGEGRGLVA